MFCCNLITHHFPQRNAIGVLRRQLNEAREILPRFPRGGFARFARGIGGLTAWNPIGKPWGNHGKPIGKSWETHRKIMGNP